MKKVRCRVCRIICYMNVKYDIIYSKGKIYYIFFVGYIYVEKVLENYLRN